MRPTFARTLISVGLRDPIAPPSTVFAAYNAITAPKEIVVLPYSGHLLPTSQVQRQLADFAGEFTQSSGRALRRGYGAV